MADTGSTPTGSNRTPTGSIRTGTVKTITASIGEVLVTARGLQKSFGDRQILKNVAFDMLVEALGLVLGTDQTLGGLCDWIEPEAPAPVDLPVAGGIAYKAAVIPVALHYTTTGPLA